MRLFSTHVRTYHCPDIRLRLVVRNYAPDLSPWYTLYEISESNPDHCNLNVIGIDTRVFSL